MWNNSSNSSSSSSFLSCFASWESQAISLPYTVVKFLVAVPPSIYFLFWVFRQRRGPETASKTTSHSDYFTFHMSAVQVFSLLALVIFFVGFYRANEDLLIFGYNCNTLSYVMEMEVHCLTCVDRYLAVVHPVTYLKLKKTRGKRVRNLALVCARLVGVGYIGMAQIYYPEFPIIPFSCLFGVIVIVICFCSVSVMHVLIRPGPNDIERVDQSKRKAFNTISAILGVLVFWFVGILVCVYLQYSLFLSHETKCFLFTATLMFNIPSNLV
ncbi:hypothetical protein NQD34_013450, partial [Periophthalmus magnuspinnatus]